MTKARRPNLYLVMALKRRYGQAKGAQDTPADVEHLGAVILMFEPGADLASIPAIRPYRQRRCKWMGTAFSILRREGAPMTARALARRVLEARGVPPVWENLKRVECSLHNVLARAEGQGVVRLPGEPKRWMIGP